ncbi:MAG: ATP-binding domain-containing protein [Acidobacteria bacterium]|nr:ATP-binding domain-containing protein [Acidobacteriota bacterium]
MNGIWWTNEKQLKGEQRQVPRLPLGESVLLTGPPGSGKTNLLLLRAKFLITSKQTNIRVMMMGKGLCDFLQTGINQYSIHSELFSTVEKWKTDFLNEYESYPDLPGDISFMGRRQALTEQVFEVINKYKLSNLFECVLLDEAHDLTPDEIKIFGKISKQIFATADSSQKIYRTEDPISTLRELAPKRIELVHNFRNGHSIAKLADNIAQNREDYKPMLPGNNYDEEENPSSVNLVQGGLALQFSKAMEAINLQRRAFPDELIGILIPTNDSAEFVMNLANSTEYGEEIIYHGRQGHGEFSPDKQIVLSTIHSAKGMEFRAVHLLAAEEIRHFGKLQRNVAYTAITRAKTSLTIYHEAELPRYLHQGILDLDSEDTPPPQLADLF